MKRVQNNNTNVGGSGLSPDLRSLRSSDPVHADTLLHPIEIVPGRQMVLRSKKVVRPSKVVFSPKKRKWEPTSTNNAQPATQENTLLNQIDSIRDFNTIKDGSVKMTESAYKKYVCGGNNDPETTQIVCATYKYYDKNDLFQEDIRNALRVNGYPLLVVKRSEHQAFEMDEDDNPPTLKVGLGKNNNLLDIKLNIKDYDGKKIIKNELIENPESNASPAEICALFYLVKAIDKAEESAVEKMINSGKTGVPEYTKKSGGAEKYLCNLVAAVQKRLREEPASEPPIIDSEPSSSTTSELAKAKKIAEMRATIDREFEEISKFPEKEQGAKIKSLIADEYGLTVNDVASGVNSEKRHHIRNKLKNVGKLSSQDVENIKVCVKNKIAARIENDRLSSAKDREWAFSLITKLVECYKAEKKKLAEHDAQRGEVVLNIAKSTSIKERVLYNYIKNYDRNEEGWSVGKNFSITMSQLVKLETELKKMADE